MVLIIFIAIILSSVIIYFAGDYFAEASSNIGDFLGLSRSVKGATFDAISSSLPELLVAIIHYLFSKNLRSGLERLLGQLFLIYY